MAEETEKKKKKKDVTRRTRLDFVYSFGETLLVYCVKRSDKLC